MNANPKTTSTKPATRSSRNWSRKRPAPSSCAPTPRATNTAVKPSTNGKAREHDATGRATITEPIRLDRRDGGQISRHERQHAGREERDEACEESDEWLGRPHLVTPRTGRAPRRPAARAPGREQARAPRPGSRLRLHVHARAPTTTAPTARAPSGRSQARRSKPRLGGSASTPGPNWSTSSALISAALWPAAICARMNAFIRVAIGELDWSSVVLQVGQTISASRSAWTGLPAAAAPARASAASSRREQAAHEEEPRASLTPSA